MALDSSAPVEPGKIFSVDFGSGRARGRPVLPERGPGVPAKENREFAKRPVAPPSPLVNSPRAAHLYGSFV
jgi:hypothetical protein